MQPAEPGDAHVKEAYIAENVERPSEPVPMPLSPSPVPMQVVAPVPVATPSPIETPAPLESELMLVKGIGEKRAAQLKALGINNLDDLAKVSPDDVAKNLMISPKITRKWVESAKELGK
jgi:predicted flap endonuclease-1-like 5' DNA nuclease